MSKTPTPANNQVRRGLEKFRQEVEEGVFPQEEYSPYKMSANEELSFQRLLAKVGNRELCHNTVAVCRDADTLCSLPTSTAAPCRKYCDSSPEFWIIFFVLYW